jgi:hypothetical protein
MKTQQGVEVDTDAQEHVKIEVERFNYGIKVDV